MRGMLGKRRGAYLSIRLFGLWKDLAVTALPAIRERLSLEQRRHKHGPESTKQRAGGNDRLAVSAHTEPIIVLIARDPAPVKIAQLDERR